MKHILEIILIASLLVFAGCSTDDDGADDNKDINQQPQADGRVVATVTDAAADMGSVTSVYVTIDNLQLYSEAEGWVTISEDPVTVDLLNLKAEDRHELFADAKINSEDYTQAQFDFVGASVVDAEGSQDAKLPSKEYNFDVNIMVKEDQTAVLSLDIIADESLYVTEDGTYVLAPVTEVESRSNAEVDASNQAAVIINGGEVTSNTKIGMDIDGNVGVGLGIDDNLDLNLGADGALGLNI